MSEARIADTWLTDPAAQSVITLLTNAGHQAYFVGGCVRNALLGEPVSDIDIATDARPDIVTNLAKNAGFKAIPTGIDHGTVTVVVGGQPFEITTFRRDVETDGRRAVVAFAETLEEDAQRRDFTVNALYADADGKVRDPVSGLPDLAARKLRFIGDPQERIREDALRILRFFRFHAWYGDPSEGQDPEGLAACAENVEMLDQLSRERVGHEMRKLLSAQDPAPAMASFAATGGLSRILPGASTRELAVLVHVETEADLDADWIRRLVLLGGQDVADRLRLSKAEARALDTLTDAMSSVAGARELGYRLGLAPALSVIAIRATQQGRLVTDAEFSESREGAQQVFPLKARDFPQLVGPEIGKALATAERQWIESGFTLSRKDLIG